VKKDLTEARKWLEKAAAQDDPYAADLLKEIE
jgi:TPR repeat protein